MSKSQYVSSLVEGTPVNSRFCVLNPRPRSGKGPIKLTLRDRTGDIPAKAWPKNAEDPWQKIRNAEYADVKGSVEYSDFIQGLEVTIDSFQPVEMNDPSDFIPQAKCDVNILRRNLYEAVQSIRDPWLHELLKRFFVEDTEFRHSFYSAPAAQYMHHAYGSGLLEHSLEVARLCDALAPHLGSLHRDLLVTAALLHDIGKIEEIDPQAGGFTFTRIGGMLGHVFLGTERVRQVISQINQFPSELSDALCHLLLSHHGKFEWGAPVQPCFIEAFLLHAADELSVKSFYCRQAQKEETRNLFQKTTGLEGHVFTGSFTWNSRELELPSADEAKIVDVPGIPPLQIVNGGLKGDVVSLPLLGSIAAGIPSDEQEHVEGYYPLPSAQGSQAGDFFLRVRGDSMIGAHILDGDVVHIRRQNEASDGDIVVALVDGESTLKRFVREDGQVHLRAENPDYPDIIPIEALEIQGKVVGVVRGMI